MPGPLPEGKGDGIRYRHTREGKHSRALALGRFLAPLSLVRVLGHERPPWRVRAAYRTCAPLATPSPLPIPDDVLLLCLPSCATGPHAPPLPLVRCSMRHTRCSSRSLLSLDEDALLCIARQVPSEDWMPLAASCKALRAACRRADAEWRRSVDPLDRTGPLWRTNSNPPEPRRRGRCISCGTRPRPRASGDSRGREAGYQPDERTLRDIAFRGDVSLYREVRASLHPLGPYYPIYRHAGRRATPP